MQWKKKRRRRRCKMANPRRFSNTFSPNLPTTTNFSSSSENNTTTTQSYISISSIIWFLKRPLAFPFLLSIFLLLTWVFLRLQHLHRFSSSSSPQLPQKLKEPDLNSYSHSHSDADVKANLVRFSSAFPSHISKDNRGWLLDPVSLAHHAGLSGGAVSCVSVHVGQIRPGGVRGNHRHYTCNETFVIWGAETRFRLENPELDKGYAEVTIGAREVAVASSPSRTAHALVNVDPSRITFFLGCQDSVITPNSSTTDFNVWKDL